MANFPYFSIAGAEEEGGSLALPRGGKSGPRWHVQTFFRTRRLLRSGQCFRCQMWEQIIVKMWTMVGQSPNFQNQSLAPGGT